MTDKEYGFPVMTRFAVISENENRIEVSEPQLKLFLCNPVLSPFRCDSNGSVYALDTTTNYAYCIEPDGLVYRIVSLDSTGNCGWEDKFAMKVRKEGCCR